MQSFCAIFDSSPLGSLQDKLTKHEETSFSGQHYVDTGAVTRKRVKRADSDDLRGGTYCSLDVLKIHLENTNRQQVRGSDTTITMAWHCGGTEMASTMK